jgi:hypothetical protein
MSITNALLSGFTHVTAYRPIIFSRLRRQIPHPHISSYLSMHLPFLLSTGAKEYRLLWEVYHDIDERTRRWDDTFLIAYSFSSSHSFVSTLEARLRIHSSLQQFGRSYLEFWTNRFRSHFSLPPLDQSSLFFSTTAVTNNLTTSIDCHARLRRHIPHPHSPAVSQISSPSRKNEADHGSRFWHVRNDRFPHATRWKHLSPLI